MLIHTADATQLDSVVASASAVCMGITEGLIKRWLCPFRQSVRPTYGNSRYHTSRSWIFLSGFRLLVCYSGSQIVQVIRTAHFFSACYINYTDHIHPVHEKTLTLYALPYLWQTTSDFNEILRQPWHVKWQTSRQISVKLVNICNSYSKFSKVTQKHKCPIGTGVIGCQVWVRANGKTLAHLKSVFKMSTVCLNATSKTRMPLPDRFIDDHLVEMLFPLFDQARLQLVDVTKLAAVHRLLQLPPNLVVDWVKVRTVGWPQSWGDEVWCFMS